jgi:hypothetical protein
MAYFQTKKSQFGLIQEGLAIEGVGIFYDHLIFLWLFGICCGQLV